MRVGKRLMLDDIDKKKDLSGKTYIVTGANSGVGFETTRQLVKQGGHVIMACRRVDNAKEVAKAFDKLKGSYDVIKIDLADLKSIREFVNEFKSKYDKLDGLDCNAGLVVFGKEMTKTKDGFETTIGVNYFGHFLLVELLLDVLKNTPESRIVLLSSVVHAGKEGDRPNIHLDDLNYENRKYVAMRVYAEAKLATILYARELNERLKGENITTYSVHPGWARSNFGGDSFALKIFNIFLLPFKPFVTDSNEEGAQTSLHCLISDEAPKNSGEYFSQWSALYNEKECKPGGWPMKSPNPHANDLELARELVKKTRELIEV